MPASASSSGRRRDARGWRRSWRTAGVQARWPSVPQPCSEARAPPRALPKEPRAADGRARWAAESAPQPRGLAPPTAASCHADRAQTPAPDPAAPGPARSEGRRSRCGPRAGRPGVGARQGLRSSARPPAAMRREWGAGRCGSLPLHHAGLDLNLPHARIGHGARTRKEGAGRRDREGKDAGGCESGARHGPHACADSAARPHLAEREAAACPRASAFCSHGVQLFPVSTSRLGLWKNLVLSRRHGFGTDIAL